MSRTPPQDQPLVEVRGLSVSFAGERGAPAHAVRDVSFTVRPGECLAIAGESGSGKSVTARSLLGLAGPDARVTAETLRIAGKDATGYGDRQWRAVRGRHIGLVLQDALVSLDPLRPTGREISEALRLHLPLSREEAAARAVELLRLTGTPEPELRARQYPHQLSGGLRQRALIACALACDPPLIVADEPTTALDVTVQAQILRLLAERKAAGTALLLISHDLSVVAQLADRVMVMKDGLVVEEGPARRLLTAPRHPYTRQLRDAAPTGLRRARDHVARPASAAPTGPAAGEGTPLIEARGLNASYDGRRVVDDVSFSLREGETLGLVGESGSGKTTLARLVTGLIRPDEGRLLVDGRTWQERTARERRETRRSVQTVHQDPLGSFDPRFSVRRVLEEALTAGRDRKPSRASRREHAAELLERVGLGAALLERRPLHLSGGQRQRVAIARALALRPRVLVCDEPVSALDVTVQAEILRLLDGLRAEHGVACLFISHDLRVVREVSDRVVVLKDGRAVETGDTEDVFTEPRHAYTRELLSALPDLPEKVLT
ncbi:ABC transporter ATP-binding protein [Streptomyces cyaneofuscatus]|uniref:dipeptide ABC transporter ATP-binding protein n=1 Tax=Streptomyces cyaneofuscatus TaxID=66883 RepID=UPI003865F016|nr:ABC transporter ATP-binding protein [Streptomyces cyaneofuscatus]